MKIDRTRDATHKRRENAHDWIVLWDATQPKQYKNETLAVAHEASWRIAQADSMSSDTMHV